MRRTCLEEKQGKRCLEDLDYLSSDRVATEGDEDREVRVLHLEGLHICDQA